MEKYLDDPEIKRPERDVLKGEKTHLAVFLDALSGNEFILTVPFARRNGNDSKK